MFGEDPDNELDRIIGARARILRLKRKLTPAEAAAKCGVSTEQILAMENGQVSINAATIISLCRLYETKAQCFYAGTFDNDGRRSDARLFVQLLKNSGGWAERP